MSKLLNVVIITITVAVIGFGINKMMSSPDCYYVSQDKAVCDK